MNPVSPFQVRISDTEIEQGNLLCTKDLALLQCCNICIGQAVVHTLASAAVMLNRYQPQIELCVVKSYALMQRGQLRRLALDLVAGSVQCLQGW